MVGRVRTAVVAAGAGTSFCFTSWVVYVAPVFRTAAPADEEPELSDVLESVLAERVDLTAVPDFIGC